VSGDDSLEEVVRHRAVGVHVSLEVLVGLRHPRRHNDRIDQVDLPEAYSPNR
jgi:hypothetical protein